jgi:hypothetical protein
MPPKKDKKSTGAATPPQGGTQSQGTNPTPPGTPSYSAIASGIQSPNPTATANPQPGGPASLPAVVSSNQASGLVTVPGISSTSVNVQSVGVSGVSSIQPLVLLLVLLDPLMLHPFPLEPLSLALATLVTLPPVLLQLLSLLPHLRLMAQSLLLVELPVPLRPQAIPMPWPTQFR